jgi:hypothetical protein
MRMLLKVTIPVAKGNAALRDGSMQPALQDVMEQLKPEAAYFLALNGHRTALFFFEMQSQADSFSVLQPFWLNLEAEVELVPAMDFSDLQAGLASMGDNAFAMSRETGSAAEVME